MSWGITWHCAADSSLCVQPMRLKAQFPRRNLNVCRHSFPGSTGNQSASSSQSQSESGTRGAGAKRRSVSLGASDVINTCDVTDTPRKNLSSELATLGDNKEASNVSDNGGREKKRKRTLMDVLTPLKRKKAKQEKGDDVTDSATRKVRRDRSRGFHPRPLEGGKVLGTERLLQ